MIEHVGKWQFLASVIVFDILVVLICVVGVLMRRDFIFEEDGGIMGWIIFIAWAVGCIGILALAAWASARFTMKIESEAFVRRQAIIAEWDEKKRVGLAELYASRDKEKE